MGCSTWNSGLVLKNKRAVVGLAVKGKQEKRSIKTENLKTALIKQTIRARRQA